MSPTPSPSSSPSPLVGRTPPPGFAGSSATMAPPSSGTSSHPHPAANNHHRHAVASPMTSIPPPGGTPQRRPPSTSPGPAAASSSSSYYEQRGAALRRAGGTYSAPPGTRSAPPPPGFGAAASRGLPRAPPPPAGRQPPPLLRPSEITGAASVAGAAAAAAAEDHQKRTTSFANLAAALGEGLAESMDSSLDRQRSGQKQQLRLSQANVSALPVGVGGSQHSSSGGSTPSLFAAASQRDAGARLVGSSRPASAASASSVAAGDAGGGLEPHLRYAPVAAAAARMAAAAAPLSKDGPTPSTAAETAPSPSVVSLHSSRSTPMSLYPPALTPSPAARAVHHNGAGHGHHGVGVGAGGVVAEEPPRPGSGPSAVPTAAMHGLSLGQGGVGVGGEASASRPISAPALTHRAPSSADGGKSPLAPARPPPSGSTSPHGYDYPGPHRAGGGGGAGTRSEAAPPAAVYAHRRAPQTAEPENGRADAPETRSYALSAALAADALRTAAERELAPFVWAAGSSGGGRAGGSDDRMPSPTHRTSRGLVILGAAGLHVPDVRSTCEAFGPLMSFRHEFRETRGVVFLSYHDLRSARYSAMELAGCLEKLAAPPRGCAGGGGGGGGEVKVRYCVALNSSSAHDESMIVLGNMPPAVDRESLKQMMTSYGAVRSVRMADPGDATAVCSGSSFVVEFYDIQDARQALSELESGHPWGLDVAVSVGARHPTERKQGQDLLSLLGRWRRGEQRSASAESGGSGDSPAMHPGAACSAPSSSASSDSTSPLPQAPDMSGAAIPGSVSASLPGGTGTLSVPVPGAVVAAGGGVPAGAAPPMQQHAATQLVIGPDGNYTYVVVNPAAVPPIPQHIHHHPPPVAAATHVGPYVPAAAHQQHIVHGPHGTYVTSIPAAAQPLPPPHQVHHHPGQPMQHYVIHHHPTAAVHHHPHHHHPAAAMPQYHHLPPGAILAAPPPQYVEAGGHHHHHPAAHGGVPMYASGAPYVLHSHPGGIAVVSGGDAEGRGPGGGGAVAVTVAAGGGAHHRPPGGAPRATSEEAAQLLLSIDAVRAGADVRTSLMVRNIPNKYTQQMLLSEFAEGGHGPDKIDFFYLPIDFKNRCNRGYAFVNLVDYRDIVSFHECYNGKRWKVFNSDKICDITYARIQGKAAMMKRFQNSALMEKEDEYKPLVFVSHGPDKGKREEFPAPAEP